VKHLMDTAPEAGHDAVTSETLTTAPRAVPGFMFTAAELDGLRRRCYLWLVWPILPNGFNSARLQVP
jgi:hypothetical protein